MNRKEAGLLILAGALMAGIGAWGILGLHFATLPEAQDSTCLHYEPAVLELAGTIELMTYPGPPNFEDCSKGDVPESCAILRLQVPICVLGDPNSDINSENERDQGHLQLVVSEAVPSFSQFANGGRYFLRGTLSHGHTGHHRTPVLMVVQAIRPASL